MPPPTLPTVVPVIPPGYLFVAVTRRDPAEPVAIMGWPTRRRDRPGEPEYDWPVTAANVELRCQQENLDMVSWRIVRYQDIPADRTYRDAWEHQAGAIVHHLGKAREIHRQHLRSARSAKLAALDVAYQRADEDGDQPRKRQIAAQKQALRDLPTHPDIEAAQTIAQLRAFWPADLD